MRLFPKRSWRASRQTVNGASRSVFIFSLLLVSGFWILASLPAQAIIDTNQNGASDPWERHHNNGNLFTAFDPTADPDGDGWTNEQEAITGTNPSDGRLPAGFLRPVIEHISAVYLSPEVEGGEPTLLSPQAVSIRWNTISGKKYTVLVSSDLTPGSWIPIGEPQIGNIYLTPSIYIPLTQPDGSIPEKLFFRVSAEDTDTDSDTLTDYEENQLGSSPYSADGDYDGISDPDEFFIYQTNFNLADSDNDGVTDGDEILFNFTNPLSATDADEDGIADDFEKHFAKLLLAYRPEETYWEAYYSSLLAGNLDATHDYTDEGMSVGQLAEVFKKIPDIGPSNSGYLVEQQERRNSLQWAYYYPPPSSSSSEGTYLHSVPDDYDIHIRMTTTADLSSQYLLSRIDSVPWGRSRMTSGDRMHLYSAMAESAFRRSPVFLPNGTKFQGVISQQRCRLINTNPGHDAYVKNYLKVTNESQYFTWAYKGVISMEPFTVQFPKGRILSDWYEFKAPIVDETGGRGANLGLLPVEVTVVKEGETAAPDDGLIVKKSDTVRYRLSPGLPDTPLLLEDEIQWHWRILKGDGTYGNWTAYTNGKGHTFTAQPQDAGIYEVKATMDGQDFFLKRAKDDPHSAKKKDENECFGVVEQDWQINVRTQAKAILGGVAYRYAAANPPLGVGDPKCNLFVAHKATDGGAPVPWINGGSYYIGTTYPPVANQWAGTESKHIPNWTLLPRQTYPQPGWVIARGVTGGTGHTGIIDYDGAWIGSGEFNVNRKADLRNAFYNDDDPATARGPARFRKFN